MLVGKNYQKKDFPSPKGGKVIHRVVTAERLGATETFWRVPRFKDKNRRSDYIIFWI